MIPESIYLREKFKGCFKSNAEWFGFYSDMNEEIPDDALTPYVKEVYVNAWVDTDHNSDRLTCFSHTGALVFLKSSPILW